MRILRSTKAVIIMTIVLLLGVLLASCKSTMGESPRVWIDVPRDGAQVELGRSILVQSHAYAREGVGEILLMINGVPYQREPPPEPGATFTEIKQEWLPNQAGEYLLQVGAFDIQGASSEPATIRVVIIEPVAKIIITPTPPQMITPRIITTTPTSPPPPQVRLWADDIDLEQGNCTQLHWEVFYGTQAFLNWEEVESSGTRRVCPNTITTYLLHVEAPGGNVDQTLSINVAAPIITIKPDTSPPVITNIAAADDTIYKPNCNPNELTIHATVRDDTGVSRVEVRFRVVEDKREGQWRNKAMSKVGGDGYQGILTWDDFRTSLDPPLMRESTIEYLIQAWDANGNLSQSRTQRVTLKQCLI